MGNARERVAIGSIVIRCAEYDQMAAFWQAALGYEVAHTDPNGGFVILRDPQGRHPNVSIDQSPVPRSGKRSWIHLDLYTVDQPAEVDRLVALGARRYPWRYPENPDYVVLEDPGGNLFCVVEVPESYVLERDRRLALGEKAVASLHCRAPIPADAPTLARLHVAAWQKGYRGLMPDAFLDALSAQDAEPRWVALLADDTGALLVAEVEGEVLGASRFGPTLDRDVPAQTAEIHSLNVDPAAWGYGVGSALLTAAMERLANQGYTRVSLWVVHGNRRARALYERHGFVTDGTDRTTTQHTGSALHEVRYLRPLVESGTTASRD
jgi:ribosomal protein S18 acetylase RimI-like enzyme